MLYIRRLSWISGRIILIHRTFNTFIEVRSSVVQMNNAFQNNNETSLINAQCKCFMNIHSYNKYQCNTSVLQKKNHMQMKLSLIKVEIHLQRCIHS